MLLLELRGSEIMPDTFGCVCSVHPAVHLDSNKGSSSSSGKSADGETNKWEFKYGLSFFFFVSFFLPHLQPWKSDLMFFSPSFPVSSNPSFFTVLKRVVESPGCLMKNSLENGSRYLAQHSNTVQVAFQSLSLWTPVMPLLPVPQLL